MTTVEQPFNVLFLCTGNSARSIIAEAILNKVGGGRFRAYSAGSMPTGRVNPLALELLASKGFPTDGLCSKSWDDFAIPGAPFMHFVFTVCGQAGAEVCPVWPDKPMTAQWGIPDPAAAKGTDEARWRAFNDAFITLHRRITLFVALPLDKLKDFALRTQLNAIGGDAKDMTRAVQ